MLSWRSTKLGARAEGRFKILIAGGSLVGLSLLFEKGEFAPQLGAWIGLHSHALRILDQLGVRQDIEKAVAPLRDRIHYNEHGRCFEESHVLAEINNKGERIQVEIAIVRYEEATNGVLVTTQDGTTHHGHILVGADGIHSRLRRLVSAGFTSEYNCIFVHIVYYHRFSAVAATGVDGLFFWFLFVNTATVSRTPNCPRLSDVDAEALIEEYGLWEARVKATLVPLEEGATINPGLGVNLAIEGIAHFTNILVPLLKAHPMPSFEQLAGAFEEYHARQRPRADAVVSMSGRITRYKAQETWLYKFAAQYVVPLVSDSVKASAYAKSSNNGPWLEYLPLGKRPEQLEVEISGTVFLLGR
ncbi:hypothetical protein BDW60DRAFT_216088 [Aspergillus nidulans var. acristatus]